MENKWYEFWVLVERLVCPTFARLQPFPDGFQAMWDWLGSGLIYETPTPSAANPHRVCVSLTFEMSQVHAQGD